jgi:hypothetical protein
MQASLPNPTLRAIHLKRLFKFASLTAWAIQTRLTFLFGVALVLLSLGQLANFYLAKLAFVPSGASSARAVIDLQNLHQITRLLNSTKSLFLDVSLYSGATRGNVTNATLDGHREALGQLAQRLSDNTTAVKRLWQSYQSTNPDMAQSNFASKFLAVSEKLESNILQPLTLALRGGQTQLSQDLTQVGLASVTSSLLNIEALIDLQFDAKKNEVIARQDQYQMSIGASSIGFIVGLVLLSWGYITTMFGLKKTLGATPEELKLAVEAITQTVGKFDKSSPSQADLSAMAGVRKLNAVFKVLVQRATRPDHSSAVLGNATALEFERDRSIDSLEQVQVKLSQKARHSASQATSEHVRARLSEQMQQKKNDLQTPAPARTAVTPRDLPSKTEQSSPDEQDWKLF